jgi:hypothetical protein
MKTARLFICIFFSLLFFSCKHYDIDVCEKEITGEWCFVYGDNFSNIEYTVKDYFTGEPLSSLVKSSDGVGEEKCIAIKLIDARTPRIIQIDYRINGQYDHSIVDTISLCKSKKKIIY